MTLQQAIEWAEQVTDGLISIAEFRQELVVLILNLPDEALAILAKHLALLPVGSS